MNDGVMKRFADLYALLDETTKTSVKVEALRGYFADSAAGGRGVGGVFPDRAEAAAGRRHGPDAGLGGRGGGGRRLALSGVL